MADFTTIALKINTNTQAAPTTWTTAMTGEIRWLDTNAGGLSTASGSWPFMSRPNTTQTVNYMYVYTGGSAGLGSQGTGGAPIAFAYTNYLQARWEWDAIGSFASAPILTAYPTTGHGAVTRGDGSLLGGHATDTGGTARSYLKANMFGRVGVGSGAGISNTPANAPAAAPAGASAVTDGTTGSVSPTAGANWLATWQGLQGDSDYITFPASPAIASTQEDCLYLMLQLWTGPNESSGTHQPVIALKYSFS